MKYIASPYSFDQATPEVNKIVRERRYTAVMKLCAEMKLDGELPVSSILHWHEAAKMFTLCKEARGWKEFNRELLLRCNDMMIYRLPGWRSSDGIEYERMIAKRNSITIEHRIPEDLVKREHEKLLADAKRIAIQHRRR